jgi:hypothetical protein
VINCLGSPFDPFDPSDDLVASEVVFWANNSTGVVDLDATQRWRQYTNDFYTGTAYAHIAEVHPTETVVLPSSNFTHLADMAFANDTVEWLITYNNPPLTGGVALPASWSNMSFYVDPAGELERSNDTHNVNIIAGPIQEIFIQQPEFYFDWATLASTTVPGQGFAYELQTPEGMDNLSNPLSSLFNITNAVVAEASATNAYETALALQTFLAEGNATTEFKRNYNGSGIPSSEDLSVVLVEATKEGTCNEFNTAFVTMARLAGLPARYVTGFAGGTWNGDGYAVFPEDRTTWGEVRLQQNSANGNTDLGWIAFDACPAAEEIEIVNQSISSLVWDRDGSSSLNVSGQLRFAENGTPIQDLPMVGYLVPLAEAGGVPGPAAIPNYEMGAVITDANGSFEIIGNPLEPGAPGIHRVVIKHLQSGYVAEDGIIFDGFINVTDDSLINHTGPNAIDAPVAGAGATTIITGILSLENPPSNVLSSIAASDSVPEVWMTFTSSVDGAVNLTSPIGFDGTWSIEVELDPLETKTNLSATLGFSGWQDTSEATITPVQFHMRPSTKSIVLDVRDAPTLTATLEGPLANNSIILIDDDIWVNGSAVTSGANPVAMPGNLSFSMRSNGSGTDWIEIFNNTVNGTFSVQHLLTAGVAQIASGEIELQVRFFPDAIEATDDANMSSGAPYLLRGWLQFTTQAVSQLRGTESVVLVSMTDHRGVDTDLLASGNFDFTFNGTWVNTTVDPESETITLNWLLANDMYAGDYPFDISFNGSELYQPSVGQGSVRVAAEVGWNITLSQDWTHIGNSSYIFGDIFDAVHTNRKVLGDNITMLSLIMTTIEGQPIDLSQGLLNNTTSEYNLSFTVPVTSPSNAYEFILNMDFDTQAPVGGPYYRYVDTTVPPATPVLPSTLVGFESEFVVSTGRSNLIVEVNGTIDFNATITDVADDSNISDASVEFIFDYGNTNVSMGTAISDEAGFAGVGWTANGIAPGYYDVLMIVYDDLSDPLATGNSRRTGNSTLVNLTVQVPSTFRIDSIPTTVTAGLNFNVLGQVLDDDNTTRPLIAPVELSAFWLSNPEELLVPNYQTSTNGTFNMSIPTDTSGNGTLRGNKVLVITVVEGSSPFYLTASTQNGMLVMGVSRFENVQPLNPIIVNRGDEVNMSARLVESSNLFLPLAAFDVDIEFHETWLPGTQTDGEGFANFSYVVPTSHPLGLITVNLVFNGSVDLLATDVNLSSITIRSTTILVVDPIAANPVAGTSFDVSGTVLSDNNSGLEQRDGTLLPANILFAVNGQPIGFTVSGGSVGAGGVWNATITLGSPFPAGNNTLAASFIPSVNYYGGSTANETFDSRGFTTLIFIKPALDGLGDPSLNDRTERGDNVSFQILLRDNTDTAVGNQQVLVGLPGLTPSAFTTFENGTAFGTIAVPENFSVGPADLFVEFAGTPGTVGLLGSNATTQFVVLGQTNLTITEAPSTLTAGDSFIVNGSLMDDLGLPLMINGVPSLAVVHLLVDGVPVSSIETDAQTGAFTLGWTLPEDTSAGAHMIEVRFLGGRDWVDPVGVGDQINPEYYLPSMDQVDFNVSVPTKVLLLTPGGNVDREETMTIQGRLLDLVDAPLPNLTIEVWLGGQWMTNVTTDANGTFTAIYPVPADAELGPITLETRFTGTTFYLPSEAMGTWTVYSPILVTVTMESPVAVAENISISGSVVDNQLLGVGGHVVDLTVEGVLLASVTTDANGDFTYEWTVPDIFSFGNHTLNAMAEAQGYYRSNAGNTTFFLAHRSDITLIFDDGRDATRGDTWALSGRLFDIDTVNNDGLPSMSVSIRLDDVEVATAVTLADGTWSTIVPATMELTRGEHTFTVAFAGTTAHLEASSSATALVWSNTLITIDGTSSNIVVRSDDVFAPIVLTGSIAEIGGQGEVFNNLTLYLGNGSECVAKREGARCLDDIQIAWNNGNFSMNGKAPAWLEAGGQYLHIDAPRDEGLYLNGASESHLIYVKVNADIEVSIDDIIEDEQEDVSGNVIVTAQDTNAGISSIKVTVYLYNANGSQLSEPIQPLTDANGIAAFDFNSDPPYGDVDVWGEVYFEIIIDDPRLSDQSRADFDAQASDAPWAPEYQYAEITEPVPTWVYVMALLILAAGAAGTVLYRRRKSQELMEEAAEIFAYTAELLAAGDSIREAIFTCYQNLCASFQQHGFLRRDFETVREFEMAIRQAMPQISEDALVALDNMFEQARYSREELGSQHQAAAQQALERMGQEISGLTKVPAR